MAEKLHDIAHHAVAALETVDGIVVIEPDAARSLQSMLILTAGSTEVEWAVRSLLIVAARLTREGHPAPVETLTAICCAATTALVQLGSKKNVNVMRRAIERLAAFTCASTNRTAPRETSTKRHQRSGVIFDHLTARPVRA